MINPTTGAMSVPAALGVGTYTFTVTASNSEGSDSKVFTLTITAAPVAPVITGPTPLSASFVNGTGGTVTVTASGTPAPTFTASGTGSTGVTINPISGVMNVPAALAPGVYTFTVTATNSAGTALGTFTLTITPNGNGAATVGDGILVVDGTNATGDGAFTLAGGQTDPTRIDTSSGYSYTLKKGGKSWYLVSQYTGILPSGRLIGAGGAAAVPAMSAPMLVLLALLLAGGAALTRRKI
jgi:PKD repeat protein